MPMHSAVKLFQRRLWLTLWAVVLVCIPWVCSLRGQNADGAGIRPEATSYQKEIQPFLAKNCYLCHNEKLNTASLNLEAYRDAGLALQQTQVWRKVLEKLSAGKMPPPGLPRPDPDQVNRVTAWIQGVLHSTETPGKENPGRVTARRLNRVEYTNTIRDLLGVPFQAVGKFPTDDSGYGFDNIGDVLSLSPLLMEKYLAAAKQISREAVYGPSLPPKPTLLARLMAKKAQDTGGSLSGENILPYSMRGALYGTYWFPVDGEYEFRVRVANYRGQDPNDLPPERRRRFEEIRRGFPVGQQQDQEQAQPPAAPKAPRFRRSLTPEEIRAREEESRTAFPPVTMVMTLDGKPVLTGVVEGDVNYQYSRGEFVGRAKVKAGEHFLRASYPELADLPDPRKNINPDGRRKLYVDYLNIVGPFNPSAEPPESYQRIFICGHAPGRHRPECARKILQNLAMRAYRRPATSAEVEGLLRFVTLARKQGDSFEEGIRVALEAILVSPHFLFRIERDPNPSDAASPHPVSQFELASRLSYFLWASMPDDELLRLAREEKLRDPQVLESQIRRMLADPKSESLVDDFASQWLQLRNLDRVRPDSKRFSTVDDELLDAMRRETKLFVDAIIHEDRSVLDFIDAPFTFLNGPLARHYGIPGVTGEEFQRVNLSGEAAEQRGGVLSQGSVLTISSYATRTSPVLRGRWVLDNLLGTPPPPPPPNVPQLNEAALGSTASMREQLEAHRKNATCAVCHNQMDPIGFGLENYDATGAWRTEDGKFPIDSSGVMPDGKSFQGPKQLKQILLGESDLFVRNLTEKMLTYALGRGLEPYDEPVVNGISRRLAADNYRFSALIKEIIKSAPFQMRSGESGARGRPSRADRQRVARNDPKPRIPGPQERKDEPQ